MTRHTIFGCPGSIFNFGVKREHPIVHSFWLVRAPNWGTIWHFVLSLLNILTFFVDSLGSSKIQVSRKNCSEVQVMRIFCQVASTISLSGSSWHLRLRQRTKTARCGKNYQNNWNEWNEKKQQQPTKDVQVPLNPDPNFWQVRDLVKDVDRVELDNLMSRVVDFSWFGCVRDTVGWCRNCSPTSFLFRCSLQWWQQALRPHVDPSRASVGLTRFAQVWAQRRSLLPFLPAPPPPPRRNMQ